jgi:predicted metalloprotease with PDZ domain
VTATAPAAGPGDEEKKQKGPFQMTTISYRIDAADVHAHQFRVVLTVPCPAVRQRVSLPAWIPGSYLVREFARHLSGLQAHGGTSPLPLTQIDKATWEVDCGEGLAELTLSYAVYAFDPSVRAAFLDARRGFFNGTSVCLRVHGREAEPQGLHLAGLPEGWQVATALSPGSEAGRYRAADYDELVDHPVELGTFWRGEFQAAGVTHEFVVAGALPDFDGARLIEDTRRICEAEIAFWHGPGGKPHFDRYVFMLNAVEDSYGGLEHRASTALIASRRDLPQQGKAEASEGYVTLLGLVAHEYFHTWNVKRLRPAEFARYDYTQENYTELLWFFEGFTSYYDDLILLRTGIIDSARYLKLLAKTVTGVLGMPGRKVHSVAQASFDAWTKYYRSDENTPNATISYYTKGSLVALCVDLTLRAGGRGTLDEVMRGLWQRSSGGPIAEVDIAAVLAQVAGRPLDAELAAWVHGTDELPLGHLLGSAGVAWAEAPPSMAQRFGARVSESALTGVKFSAVLRGGAAEAAGLSPGDELLAIDGWRVRRLDEAQRLIPASGRAQLLVSRDQRVLERSLALSAPGESRNVVLAAVPAADTTEAAVALRQAWWQGR